MTEASAEAIKTAVELIDDAIKTDDAAFSPASDKVMMIGGVLDDTSTDEVNEGDAGAIRITSDRAMFVNSYPGKKTSTVSINNVTFNNTTTSSTGSTVDCQLYREFLLFLDVGEAGSSGTKTIEFTVQQSDDGGTTWYDYMDGAFGSLLESGASANGGIKKCLTGKCYGDRIRVNAESTSTTATETFTVTADFIFVT